jgi:hypothetical protein
MRPCSTIEEFISVKIIHRRIMSEETEMRRNYSRLEKDEKEDGDKEKDNKTVWRLRIGCNTRRRKIQILRLRHCISFPNFCCPGWHGF